ncbi:MAG: hypothetical protein U0176_00950 [Bacteroidia bacterium]
MKRNAIFFALLLGLSFAPALTIANPLDTPNSYVEETELPWSTVSQVLQKVSDVRPYTYETLVQWYNAGRVQIQQQGSAYHVTMLTDDGITESVLIGNL